MQVLKQHTKIVLLAVFLVIVIIVSFFVVQQVSKPSAKPSPSPAPTTPSPVPTETSPIPTTTATSPQPTFVSFPTPGLPPPPGGLYPGEVTEYQNQTLTPVSVFAEEVAAHPDVAIDGTQTIDQTTYHLEITGLVNNTLNYTYADVINNFSSYQQVATLLCVEGWSVTMLWGGVRLSDLFQEAGASPNATVAIFYASDGYTTALPLDFIAQNNILLAYKINNVTLPAFAGYPFCLVALNQYGYKWIKWVTEIEISNNTGYLGYWESRGYPNNATVSNTDGAFDYLPVIELVGVSAVALIMVLAVYMILVKTRKKALDEANQQVA